MTQATSLIPQADTFLLQTNLKMTEASSKKCTYFNSGYCKLQTRIMAVNTFTQQHHARSQIAKIKNAFSGIQKGVVMVLNADIGQNACTDII